MTVYRQLGFFGALMGAIDVMRRAAPAHLQAISLAGVQAVQENTTYEPRI